MRTPILAVFVVSVLAGSLQPLAATAQASRFDQLKAATDDVTALIKADSSTSALCKSYIDRVVTPITFGALTANLPNTSPKGEFETTAEYEARLTPASKRASTKPVVVAVPVDRDYVRYEADAGAMFIQSGSFAEGRYGDDTISDMSGTVGAAETVRGGTPMFHSKGAARLVRTYAARSRGGVAFKVTETERTTNALYITASKLFPFARAKVSPVIGFSAPVARAPQLKATLKLALVVEPHAPFLFRGAIGPVIPSLGNPDVVRALTNVAVVKARCGLVLDAQNRVLGVVDTGT